LNRKIKISIITFISAFLLFSITNIVSAWSPNTFFPIKEGNSIYFCRQKGAGLRFYEGKLQIGILSGNFQYVDYDSTEAPDMIEVEFEEVSEAISNAFKNIAGDNKAYKFKEFEDYNGDFESWTESVNTQLIKGSAVLENGSLVFNEYETLTDLYLAGDTILTSITGPKLAGKPTYQTGAERNVSNSVTSYIMSAGRNWLQTKYPDYNTKNYIKTKSDVATIYDQQYALWHDRNYNIGNIYNGDKSLYLEAVEYKEFYDTQIKSDENYKNVVKVEAPTTPRIIVNKNTGKYIVGPYTAYYPDDGRFSFIENIYLLDQNEKEITITNVITEDGRYYPGNGQGFFIEFDYATNPTSISVGVEFAYLQTTYAKYYELDAGRAPIYNIGASVRIKCSSTPAEYEQKPLKIEPRKDENGDPIITEGTYKATDNSYSEYGINEGDYYILVDDTTKPISYNFITNVEYNISSWESGLTYEVQDGAELVDSDRVWTIVKKESEPIDICMQVGGKVFVDTPTGKEGTVDGIRGAGDSAMPNVTVHLYSKKSGGEVASTVTDGNGEYVFKDLSVLDEYYVKFDYNAQYYEPTYYTNPSNSGSYKNTSNGTDYVSERNTLNVRFASIGSAPNNYSGTNETYRKEELIQSGVMDEYGNLKLTSSSNPKLQKMIQYVKDCQMSSWTQINGSMDLYPFEKILVITQHYGKLGGSLENSDVNAGSGNTSTYSGISAIISGSIDDKSQYINQGYKQRQEVDMSLKEDIYSATIEINGKKQEYIYNTRESDSNWEIEVRLSDAYYNTQYSRELYKEDYQYKVSSYDDPSKYGKTKDDELKVYVTYKVYVKNQSMSIRTSIDEIVHYYDSEYEYVPDRSYIQITRGNNKGTYDVKQSNTSQYGSNTMTSLDGYQAMYIRGLEGIYLDGGQSAEIYLTFIVEKDVKDGEDWVKLDENVQTATPIGVGKESITEINGYSTLYKQGTDIPNVGPAGNNTVAGLVDIDSNPGNLNPSDVPKDGKINYNNFEDDTDKAPNVRIILYRNGDSTDGTRIISGYIWEDERTQLNDNQATATGNGIREDGEKLINGVTVELVEIMDNGTEFVWRSYENGSGTANKTSPIINVAGLVKDYEFTGDTTGTYAFKSFVPGNYVVRFKYGDTVKTVLAKNSDATKLLINEYGLSNELKALLNDTSYNGQDYKSTIYQSGLGTYNAVNTSKGYNYDIEKSNNVLVSDAKDLYNIRQNVINYSSGAVSNALAELLASYQNVPIYNDASYSKEMMKALLNEFMAKTSMTAETGIINMQVEYNRTQTNSGDKAIYHITNLDLGLEERPKAQIEINKDVKHLKVTLANGNVLFDANGTTENLLWQPNVIYFNGYKNNLMDSNRFTTMSNIRTQRAFGLVQPTMDEELMHGATVRIEYEITAKNIGEADYKEEQFYYTGVVKDKNTLVTTVPIQILDYVPNNLQYYEINNSSYWSVIKPEDIISQGLVNANLKANIEKFNTIITSNKTNVALVPTIYTEKVDSSKQNSVSIPLVLTQLITTENKTKDLTYNNKVELVLQSNTVGRKMAYSVPGNQDPAGEILELDADLAKVSILPPFGTTLMYIIIAVITIAGAAIIAVGIIFIKRKVLTK